MSETSFLAAANVNSQVPRMSADLIVIDLIMVLREDLFSVGADLIPTRT
jgi:hypothetical protein